ncbi:MAG: hypothetical protein KAJ24_06045 [Candidatus Aenigmarchaeota archaeon]|nr:hypothetical protein [Candidatus Aenigmarchaeota archaeon]
MEEKSLLVQFMGDTPVSRIIDFMIENKGLDFSKEEIAGGAGISRTALFNHWAQIEQFELVKVTRKFGKAKLYTLDAENEITKQILALEFKLIEHKMKSEARAQSQKNNSEISA